MNKKKSTRIIKKKKNTQNRIGARKRYSSDRKPAKETKKKKSKSSKNRRTNRARQSTARGLAVKKKRMAPPPPPPPSYREKPPSSSSSGDGSSGKSLSSSGANEQEAPEYKWTTGQNCRLVKAADGAGNVYDCGPRTIGTIHKSAGFNLDGYDIETLITQSYGVGMTINRFLEITYGDTTGTKARLTQLGRLIDYTPLTVKLTPGDTPPQKNAFLMKWMTTAWPKPFATGGSAGTVTVADQLGMTSADLDNWWDSHQLSDVWGQMQPDRWYVLFIYGFDGGFSHWVIVGKNENGDPYVYDTQRSLMKGEDTTIYFVGKEGVLTYLKDIYKRGPYIQAMILEEHKDHAGLVDAINGLNIGGLQKKKKKKRKKIQSKRRTNHKLI